MTISHLLWECVGGVAAAGAVWYLWHNRRRWRDFTCWIPVILLVAAFIWRVHIKADSSRYYAIFVLPALFSCYYLLRYAFPWKNFTRLLLITAFAGCLLRDMRYDPAEFSILDLYRKVKADAAGYRRVSGISSNKTVSREAFYTGMQIAGISRAWRTIDDFQALVDNLGVFAGLWDAVYIFRECRDLQKFQAALPPELPVVDAVSCDSRGKKFLCVMRYTPAAAADNTPQGELLPNGDFKKTLSGEAAKRSIRFLSSRAPRFAAGSTLPSGWSINHSLTARSDSFATVIKYPQYNALRMETPGYLFVTSPHFRLDEPRILNFHLDAPAASSLQIMRSTRITGKGAKIVPMISLRLPAGTSQRFTLKLPAAASGAVAELLFWLDNGVIELSDVRMK